MNEDVVIVLTNGQHYEYKQVPHQVVTLLLQGKQSVMFAELWDTHSIEDVAEVRIVLSK
jgi:hypothetical protein